MARHIPRLYVGPYSLSAGQTITLVDSQHHYLAHVLRTQVGAKTLLFNERDGEWECVVDLLSKNFVRVAVRFQLKKSRALPKTHLYFSPLRKERMMDVLEKGTELGVTHFHPVLTDHTVHGRLNMDKMLVYIQDAAEQCGRCDIPQLTELRSFGEVLTNWSASSSLFLALERETLLPLALNKEEDSICVAVGPEGGWSDEEKKRFQTLSFIRPFSLGNLTLRADTAAISSLTLVNYFRMAE